MNILVEELDDDLDPFALEEILHEEDELRRLRSRRTRELDEEEVDLVHLLGRE